MPSQKVKPSNVSGQMSMDEWFFLSGRPLIDLDSIGKTVRHCCSEASGDPIHVSTRGPGGPQVVRRPQQKLSPLHERGEWCSGGYEGTCRACRDCLPPRRLNWPYVAVILFWVVVGLVFMVSVK